MGHIKHLIVVVSQTVVGIKLLHVICPYRQSHSGTLSHLHGVEVDVAIVAAYPHSTDKSGSDTHKPCIAIVVGSTGLATYLALEIVFIAYASTRSAVNHSTQHIEHLVGTLLTDHLVHARLEMGNDIALIVLDLCDEHRCTADAMVDEGSICTHHLAHRNLARTEAQGHRGMYVGILYTIIIEQIDKLLR